MLYINTMKILIIILIAFSTLHYSTSVEAHPGGTNSAGCHVCRTNCAQYGLAPGQYHCHNTSVTPPRTPSSPPSSSSSSTDNYPSIIAFIALGIVALIVVLVIKNNSSKPIDNSKFEKGIEDLKSKLKDNKDD